MNSFNFFCVFFATVLSVLRKWHVFVQKTIFRLFQNSKFEFLEKINFKGILELKTVYFAYKHISDSLF